MAAAWWIRIGGFEKEAYPDPHWALPFPPNKIIP